jgi:hypothetical protein
MCRHFELYYVEIKYEPHFNQRGMVEKNNIQLLALK